MIVLVLGTPDSGKSKIAEDIILQLASGRDKLYIATMIPYGEEGIRRIEKHRQMRDGKGFLTVEKHTSVDSLAYEIADLGQKCCLLECMSNLVGNEMHDPGNRSLSDEELTKLIANEVLVLGKSCMHLVIVANSFWAEDEGYDDETRRYVKIINNVNEVLKSVVDEIKELAANNETPEGERS